MNLDIIVYCAAVLYLGYSIFTFIYFIYKSLSYITSCFVFIFNKCYNCCKSKAKSKAKAKNTFIELKEPELPFHNIKYAIH